MIPLYGFLQGDTIGLLVLANGEDTAADLCAKLQAAASVRVRPRGAMVALYKDRRLDPAVTVANLKMAPLERFDVVERR